MADWLRLVIECCLQEPGAAAGKFSPSPVEKQADSPGKAWYYIQSCAVNDILPTEKKGDYNGQEVVIMFDRADKWPPGPE